MIDETQDMSFVQLAISKVQEWEYDNSWNLAQSIIPPFTLSHGMKF